MTRMELIKEYISDYISGNNVTDEDVQRLYDEAWEVCRESVSCSKATWLAYIRG